MGHPTRDTVMSRMNSNSPRRLWGWLILVPLLVGASLALLQYSGQCAIVSAYYDDPSKVEWVKEAETKGDFYGWMLFGFTAAALVIATILIPPLKSESISPGLKGTLRFLLAVLLVVTLIKLFGDGILTVGEHWK
jgi:hypothetical protein